MEYNINNKILAYVIVNRLYENLKIEIANGIKINM